MSLSEVQVNDLARPLVGIITKFYADPKNEEDFQKWLRNVEERKQKESNRHKLAVIQAYIIIGTLVLIGFIGGLVVGRATAPKKQVTVTETVEVPFLRSRFPPGCRRSYILRCTTFTQLAEIHLRGVCGRKCSGVTRYRNDRPREQVQPGSG